MLYMLYMVGQCLGVTGDTNEDDILNTCMEMEERYAKYAKAVPSPEPGLKGGPCSTFASRSCCKTGVSDHWQNLTLSYAHCPQKETLTPICNQRFEEELCFYLCSPDVGPWIKTGHYGKKDAFVNLTICQSTCDLWYSACQEEHTCSDNWYYGFNMSTGMMVCLEESKCDKFDKHFTTAKMFCEQVWNNAYKVVPDDEPCMQFTYDITSGANPNKAVAEARAKGLASSNSSREVPHAPNAGLQTSSIIPVLQMFSSLVISATLFSIWT
ncbi:unnamed protein product [Owenia fusiformis]|uniref:Folate receptor-like domain-containing protein n=1 Tax=Owenia fusiformis TaxID=6347 RepID=A0A8S4N1W7_OWEFU|nr:unnamed protein product [Owenia fusiformis]